MADILRFNKDTSFITGAYCVVVFPRQSLRGGFSATAIATLFRDFKYLFTDEVKNGFSPEKLKIF